MSEEDLDVFDASDSEEWIGCLQAPWNSLGYNIHFDIDNAVYALFICLRGS